MRVFLPFSVLCADNRRYYKDGYRLRDEYRLAKQAIHMHGLNQIRGERPAFTGPVTVEYLWTPPDYRKRDPLNYLKAINDALEGVAWADDKQIGSITLYKNEPDKENAGMQLAIYEGLHRAELLP